MSNKKLPYHTIPYHTIPYHTIPYHTIPYHTTVYLCSVDKRKGPSPVYFFILKSGWMDIVYDTEQSKFWMDKIKGLYPNHVFVQKSRWSFLCRVNFGWTKYRVFPQIMSLFKSQDNHILCRIDFEGTKYRGVIKFEWLYHV